ncbi:MAG: trypsin-like peptidase domain-containing protein [Candidatus Bathyarchaeota archaeon]|nr:trypsin-like peptidase domain-containing protein [Candidatus Bathyarchaeota archaeon]
MQIPPPPKDTQKITAGILVLIFVAGALVSGLAGYFIFYNSGGNSDKINGLLSQISALQGTQNTTVQYITIYQNQTSLANLFETVKDSVVLIKGIENDGSSIQGSGFVYDFSGRMVIITNYHVVEDTTSISVTFTNGNGYAATVLGSDPYADLAILNVNAKPTDYKPIQIVSSSGLQVGEQVIAVGNPYGLVGSLTTGIVSATGRSITEDTSKSNFAIPNIIQTTTPINPGNSGGPLLNADGKVVGITTAIVSESQGLGFAIPSDTILREIYALVNTGSYSGHSYLGVTGGDMTYEKAQQIGSSITYGYYVETVFTGGPSSGVLQHNDIIVAMNHHTILSSDDLASYLEANTLPGQSLILTIIRDNQSQDVTMTLGTRPPIST